VSLNKKNTGFTIIELLIVIVVLGILVAIVVSTYSGIQVKDRNDKRQTDVQAVQTNLEAFYSQNGYYPSLNEINSVSWRDKNLPNLNASDMIDPAATNQNSADARLAASPKTDVYSYQVTDSNGNSCESAPMNCAKYTLTATYDGTVNGQKTYVKQNLD
jgi:prepilin-type N-terminal cleavage/methylation domain-containing protein